jgi:FemAB-related protein (PEP-CTERM system-associated)
LREVRPVKGEHDVNVRVGPSGPVAVDWDAFASGQHGYTHFHRFAWKALIEDVFGHECDYLAARSESGELAGVLPLVRVKSLVFGHYLMSMPFLNYGGPLGTPEAVAALGESAAREARRSGAKLLELRSRVEMPLGMAASHRKITVVLDLPPDHETLFKSFDRKLRARIRKPQKEGVTVRFGADQVEPFFHVFSRHMRDLGTPTLPRRFFEQIATRFADSSWFGCAWYAGQPVATGAGFRWGTEFEMTWGSALTKYNHIAPNMLLYWEFMQRAMADGVTLFNFGRCTPNSGTHEFKRQWGSRDEALWWYQRSADRAGDAATPSPDRGAFSLGPRIWKRLPLPIATVLGPHIVRFIP